MNIGTFADANALYEFCLYLAWYGLPHLMVAAALFFGIRRFLPRNYHPLRYLYLFPVILLVAGGVADAAWYTSVYEVKYHSDDYLADFNPFLRIWRSTLTDSYPWSRPGGPINGATFEEIYELWTIYAILTWVLAALLWLGTLLFLRRRLRAGEGEREPRKTDDKSGATRRRQKINALREKQASRKAA